jgi:hypothetical protein
MKEEFPWLLVILICTFAAVGIMSTIGDWDVIHECRADDEFNTSNLTANQSYLAELNQDITIWINENFSDNLTITLPEYPMGNILIYQGDRMISKIEPRVSGCVAAPMTATPCPHRFILH